VCVCLQVYSWSCVLGFVDLVIKHVNIDLKMQHMEIQEITRNTRYGTKQHRSDLYLDNMKEPDTIGLQIWNNIR
jgi:hypothetical protein